MPTNKGVSKIILALAVGVIVLYPKPVAPAQPQTNTATLAAHTTTVVGQAKPQPLEVHAGRPVRLKIPSINVEAAIDPMGITPLGDMEAPSGPKGVGWYKLGPYPGNSGNAVVAGHYGSWKNGEGSVFDNLHTLAKGDSVYVQDEGGSTFTFIVRELHIYGRGQPVPTVFNGADNNSHLNLITCQGEWDESQKTYSDRLVVFTDRQ